MGRVFVTKQLDKPVYQLLQNLRVAHGDATQWEILQAALVAYGFLPPIVRQTYLDVVRKAPSEQPKEYEVKR